MLATSYRHVISLWSYWIVCPEAMIGCALEKEGFDSSKPRSRPDYDIDDNLVFSV